MRKNRKPKKILSKILILTGLVVILIAILIEVNNYPWRTINGENQEESSIADPTPIVLKEKDKDVIVVIETALPTVAPSDEATTDEAEGILPGDVNDSGEQVYVYVQTGILKIPKLGISVNILEGTGYQLNYGVGHVIGTDGFGQAGNCAIAGHRPHPFRYLDSLTTGDSVIIKFGEMIYTYTVFDSFDVLPDETWVLADIPGEEYALTIITCTPYLVSSHRLIVRARLTDINGMTPADYYASLAEEASEEVDSSETVSPSEEVSPSPEVPEPQQPVSPEVAETTQPDDSSPPQTTDSTEETPETN